LEGIYKKQRDLVNRSGYHIYFQTSLNFDAFQISKDHVNYVDEGSSTGVEMSLAINEFDSSLRANINFMNADSIKCMVLEGGLQELRATLHYQLMQKQLMIVLVRQNNYLLENGMRALAELELLSQHRIKVENPIVEYARCFKYQGSLLSEDLVTA